MSQKQFLAVGVIAVVAVVIIVLLLTHALNFTLPSNNGAFSFRNPSEMSSLFSAMQNKYNSSGPFNFSYNFYINLSAASGNSGVPPGISITNGTLNMARYGNSIRGSVTSSFSYPYSIFNASIKLTRHDIAIYNGTRFTTCSKETVTNETPVNNNLSALISTANSRPFSCNSSAKNIASFDIVNVFTMIPFSVFNSLQSTNFSSFGSSSNGGSVKFLSENSYSGQSCFMEELIPPTSASANVGLYNECISSTNGVSLYSFISVNGTTLVKSTLSSVNPAPTNAATVTAIP